MEEALKMGAMALFGEKYGDSVRVVGFGDSVELCGGTHVDSTGSIGLLKITSEGAIAAGIRRIEAVTASSAETYINERLEIIDELAILLKSSANIKENVDKLISENSHLKKSLEKFQKQNVTVMLNELVENARFVNEILFVAGKVEAVSPDLLKNAAFQLRNSSENTVFVIGTEESGKAGLLVLVSDNLVKDRNINAAAIIKEISGEINGGGGGQPFLATAGGKNPSGIPGAISKAAEMLRRL